MKKILITALILVSISFASNAQPGSGGFDDEPVDAPIDGGLSILVGAGVAFGAKKIREKSIKAKV